MQKHNESDSLAISDHINVFDRTHLGVIHAGSTDTHPDLILDA